MLKTNSKTFALDQPYQDSDKIIDELVLTKPTLYQLSDINLFKLTQFESDKWIKFLPRICPELATNLDKLGTGPSVVAAKKNVVSLIIPSIFEMPIYHRFIFLKLNCKRVV